MPVALITGLGGFTGRYLASCLAQRGYQVVGLEAFAPPTAAHPIHVCDLNDKERLAAVVSGVQPDVVAHLAAISFVGHGNAEEIYQTNVIGTRNLLEALADNSHRPRSVLLASSANIYGNTAADPITESTPPEPANDYAVTKLAMEYMARLWMDRLPITIVRPFNYTGIGHSVNFLVPKIVDHFRRRANAIDLGNLNVARDFSDVRFVAETYARIVDLGPAGEVFNVCSGRAYSLGDILGMMSQVAGYRIDVTVNPAFVRANEVMTLRGSQDKLAAFIGDVGRHPFEETLRWMYSAP